MVLKLWVDEIQEVFALLQRNLQLALQLAAGLWAIHLVNWLTRYRINRYGIRVRRMVGLWGIPLAPILHGNFSHLFFNTIPFVILASLMLVNGEVIFCWISVVIIGLSGGLVWLFGRQGIHLGASSLIMGYLGYLLAQAWFNQRSSTIVLAGIAIYYCGGLLSSVLPVAKQNLSWEGHLFGLLAGVGAAYFWPNLPVWLVQSLAL